MNTDHRKQEILSSFIYVLYLIFLGSLVFAFRAVSSMGIVVLFLAEIIFNRSALTSLFQKNIRTLLIGGYFLLFLLQIVALLYTNDTQQGWSNVRIKTGLLITPLAISISSYITKAIREKLLSHYCLVLGIAALYCLCVSFIHYLEFHDPSYFFYHSLVKPLHQHAVYFSVLVMVGLLFLLENIIERDFFFPGLFHISLTIYLSIFLFLLSSKLVLAFYIFYLFSWFLRLLQNKRMKNVTAAIFLASGILIVTLVFTTVNPISNRFSEIIKGDITIITQDSFKKSDYFNGLQFRLIQWKFVGEILTEKKRWLIGVSPGDAQSILNEKYLSKNMYAGENPGGGRGYLVYNTHNQFLQTILQNGVIGVAVLLMICFSLLKIASQNKSRYDRFIILLLLAWLFTEAVFETQYGIMIFTFFPLFIYADKTRLTTLIK